MDLVSKRQIIKEIRAHAQRVGIKNNLYQLAHDHIIRIIEQMIPADPDCMDLEQLSVAFICGYRVKDLIVIAERLHNNKNFIDPIVLGANNDAFLEGYKLAYDEINASINKSIESIIGGADNSS